MAEFLNVYNFVPFPEKKATCYKAEDRHTGVITYTITTKTPLFIPNTSNDDAFKLKYRNNRTGQEGKHFSYDFYSYREMKEDKDYTNEPAEPVIPGSEIRGMVRNIYETITDSCMGVLNTENVPVMRTGAVFKAGLLAKTQDNKYELIEANNYPYYDENNPNRRIYLSDDYYEGQKVYFRWEQKGNNYYASRCRTRREDGCNTAGYVIKGMKDGRINRKKAIHIFKEKTGGNKYSINQKDIDRLYAVIKSYQTQPAADRRSYREYQKKLSAFINKRNNFNDRFPVYFLSIKEGELIYLSPASITKEMSHYSVGKLAGGMKLCSKIEELCPACDLFGRIEGDKLNAKASNIRFSDAEISNESKKTTMMAYYERKVTLPTLAEPKLGAAEFYLKRAADDAVFWTYDYYMTDSEESDNIIVKPAMLRGRKYYWHQPEMRLPERVFRTKLNKTIRPVKANITFTGKVYFDNISKKQLEQLIWILNGQEEDIELAYKLGGGKPLGLGSVECRVVKVTERFISMTDGELVYEEVHKKAEKNEIVRKKYSDEELGFSQSSKDAFLRMSDFKAVEKISNGQRVVVSYPLTEQQYNQKGEQNYCASVDSGFKWFVANHVDKLEPMGYRLKSSLPDATADKPLIPCHRE